jgi:hypothetical protein
MKSNTKKYTNDDFKRIHVIGKGSYGKVYLVRKIIKVRYTVIIDEFIG